MLCVIRASGKGVRGGVRHAQIRRNQTQAATGATSSASASAAAGGGENGGTVTVFGGSGFIGRSVVRQLAPHYAQVRVASRYPDEMNMLLERELERDPASPLKHVRPEFADVTDLKSVLHVLQDTDAVVNLVGINYEAEDSYVDIHVDGVCNVSHTARAVGVKKLVFLSTLWSDLESPSRFADSRFRAEDMTRASFPEATILRSSLVYGRDDRFLNRLLSVSRFLPLVPLPGANAVLQPVWVEDVARALVKCLNLPQVAGNHVQLGGPDVMTLRQLLTTAMKHKGGRRPIMGLSRLPSDAVAAVLQWLPDPLLTREFVPLFQVPNVVSDDATFTFRSLGLVPCTVDEAFSTYLGRGKHQQQQQSQERSQNKRDPQVAVAH